ncbi:hypothetical protein RYX36_004901 [Vicia faba]
MREEDNSSDHSSAEFIMKDHHHQHQPPSSSSLLGKKRKETESSSSGIINNDNNNTPRVVLNAARNSGHGKLFSVTCAVILNVNGAVSILLQISDDTNNSIIDNNRILKVTVTVTVLLLP